jgi:hypothetical protein
MSVHKIRAHVISNVEPQDKEVVWIKNSKMYLYEKGEWVCISGASITDYEYNGKSLTQALDDIYGQLTETPLIFTMLYCEDGDNFEQGQSKTIKIKWEYSKPIESQRIQIDTEDSPVVSYYLGNNIREYEIQLDKTTTFTIMAEEGYNSVSESYTVNFLLPVIYFSMENDSYAPETDIMKSLDCGVREFSINTCESERAVICIPKDNPYQRIMYNGHDVTDDFIKDDNIKYADQTIDFSNHYCYKSAYYGFGIIKFRLA